MVLADGFNLVLVFAANAQVSLLPQPVLPSVFSAGVNSIRCAQGGM
jgi:hypothetical protein